MSFPAPPDQSAREAAVDPNRSCIVQAPAGAGKTTLLAQRYLNLLACVEQPENVLAITFTKKAAQEMRQRVRSLLLEDNHQVVARDQEKQWDLRRNPNRLKIQTIDSFAFDLASRMVGEQSMHGWEVTDDPQRLYTDAINMWLQALYTDGQTAPLVADMFAFLDNDIRILRNLFSGMLAKRDQWLALVNDIAQAEAKAANHAAQVIAETISQLTAEDIADLLDQLSTQQVATLDQIGAILNAEGGALLSKLVTASGTLRKQVRAADGFPDLEQRRWVKAFLLELHDQGLATQIERIARRPDLESMLTDNTALSLCCLNLGLAASALEQICQERSLTDFTGVLIAAKRALRDAEGRPTDLALLLDYQIQHVLVDEFQDTSRSQGEFFHMLTEGWQKDSGNTFFAVGDPMQSIYRFRDADVEVFREAQEQGIGDIALDNISLTSNFRSSREVIAWTNTVFAQLAKEYGSEHLLAEPGRSDLPAGTVECLWHATKDAEVIACVDLIEQWRETHPDDSIGILCRARTHLSEIIHELKRRKVPFQGTDMDLLRERPCVRDLMSLTKLLLEPEDLFSWFAILRSPIVGLTLTEITALQSGLKSDPLGTLEDIPRAHLFVDTYRWARRALSERGLREIVETTWQRCGANNIYATDSNTDVRAYLELLDRLPAGLLDFSTIQRLVDTLYAEPDSDAQLSLLTIHKSKGLEYDHVLVPGLASQPNSGDSELLLWSITRRGLVMGVRGSGLYDWLREEDKYKDRGENVRLLYVACTRARKSLTLSFNADFEKSKPGGLASFITAWSTQRSLSLNQPSTIVATPSPSIPLKRLAHDYVLPSQPETLLPVTLAGQAEDHRRDAAEARAEVQLGLLIHQLLAYLGDHQLTALPDHSALDFLNVPQAASALASAQPTSIQTEEAIAHVQRLLQTPAGQWALQPRPDAEQEAAYAAFLDGEYQSVVIDRSFTDNGQRWVIDYKTGATDAADTALATEHYRRQLTTYQRILSLYYKESVRAGLLFTATGEFVEL